MAVICCGGNLAFSEGQGIAVNPTPKVAVIVLNWNRPEETAACCRSLVAQSYRNLSVWVVDNGSTANTAEDVQRLCPQAVVVRLEENRGFAGGVNVGIGAAKEQGPFDFFWLLNNDTVCEPDALQRMLVVAVGNPRMAAVGCSMVEGDEGHSHRVHAGKKLRAPLYIPREPKSSMEIDYICGASLLIRQEAMEEIGMLDEGYFFFFEDADWSLRARKKGWVLGVVEGAPIRHLGSATIGGMSRLRAAYYRAGYVRLLRTHARFPFWVAFLITGYRLCAEILRGRWATAAGTIDGWKRGWR